MEQIEHELLELWDSKRQDIASRILRRGHDPNFVLELGQEGLAELEMILVKLEEEEEAQRQRTGLVRFILSLLRNPAQQKKHQLPLLCDGLAKDPLRVKKVRIASLKKECNELTKRLAEIKNQIQIVMGYEDSQDQVARLEDSKARVEKELRQKQEEMAGLTR